MTLFHNNSSSYRTEGLRSPIVTAEIWCANWQTQGHQDHMLYQEKNRDLPTPSAVLFRGSWICWTTNIQLLMRFFFLNIKRNILYKSKHKGSIMEREKTSHKLEEAGYSIFLCLCGSRNMRFRFKTRLHHCSSVTLNNSTNLTCLFLLAKWIILTPSNT